MRATSPGWRAPLHGIRQGRRHPVIALIDRVAACRWRSSNAQRGLRPRRHHAPRRAAMPAGPGSLAREIYGRELIDERHRHRYEFNNHYREQSGQGPEPVRHLHGRQAGRGRRGRRSIPGSLPASSTRSSPRHRATVIRCLPALSRPPGPTRQVSRSRTGCRAG